MTDRLTYEELAALMKKGAGLTVDHRAMENRSDTAFDEFGLDSLGLLGIVGDQVQPCEPSPDLRSGEVHPVIVVPQRGGGLLVLVHVRSGTPGDHAAGATGGVGVSGSGATGR